MGHLAGWGWRTGKFRAASILPGNFSQVQGVFRGMKKKQITLTLALLAAGSLILPAGAQTSPAQSTTVQSNTAPTLTPEQQQASVQLLEKLMAQEPLDISLFSPEFLTAVPEEQLRQMFTQMRAQLGAFKNVTFENTGWVLNFEKGRMNVTVLRVDNEGKIIGLFLAPPVPEFASLDEAKAAFAALPGDVSVYVAEVGQSPLLAQKATRLLGVGSAFKLAILGEVQARVNAGKLKWTDEVTLTDAMKSLPSGTLQDAPAGTKYTVQDLATRMIRDSDNTATDILLDLAGREGVEARLGQAAIPSTREFFALKNPANIELLRAYRAAGLNTPARREVLKQASTAPLPGVQDFDGSRTLARDVEWFVSTQRLCQLMSDVAALPAMQANPGVASKNDFTRVSYKGGSEPGVLNLTTQVTTKAGKTYCLSATWNNSAPLDENQFMGLYAGLLKLLK